MLSFFKKRKKKNIEQDNIIENFDLSFENLNPDRTRHHVVDLCEQIIDSARELDDARSEYVMVTNYLNDIEIVENLPKEKSNLLTEYANYVSKLNKERDELLHMESKISEAKFNQIDQNSDDVPKIINRLKENEEYLAAIEHDLAVLEEEKENWLDVKEECRDEEKLLRVICVVVMSLFGVIVIVFIICWLGFGVNTQIPLAIAALLAAIVGASIVFKYQDCEKEIKRSNINRDYIITIENHVKIKYVNMKNAVDYMHEKYHVDSWRSMNSDYEKYMEMVQKREKYRITNEDLDYYKKQMNSLLSKLNLYDSKVWNSYANAILDKREMVEIKHNLIVRRQKLRSRIEYNMNTINALRREINLLSTELGDIAPQIQQVLDRVDELQRSMKE